MANARERKSPHKSCFSRLTFSSRDRFSSAQHTGNSIFLAADLLQDVFLLPGKSFAGSRGVEEGELCDSPRTGPGTSRRNSLFWNCLALIAPEDLQLLQTGFSSWPSVPAVGSQLWPHGSDPSSSKVCLQPGESSSQCAEQETGRELDSMSLQVPSNSGCSLSPRF